MRKAWCLSSLATSLLLLLPVGHAKIPLCQNGCKRNKKGQPRCVPWRGSRKKIRCRLRGALNIGSADGAVNQEAQSIASTAAEVAAFICSGGSEPVYEFQGLPFSVAFSFANTVAFGSEKWDFDGDIVEQVDAEVQRQGAKEAADRWLKAWGPAVAAAGSCSACSTYAESFRYMEQEVFRAAMAQADFKLDKYFEFAEDEDPSSSDQGLDYDGSLEGPTFLSQVLDYRKELRDILESTPGMLAAALEAAKDFIKESEEGCKAWVNKGGCIWDPTNRDPNFCSPEPSSQAGPEDTGAGADLRESAAFEPENPYALKCCGICSAYREVSDYRDLYSVRCDGCNSAGKCVDGNQVVACNKCGGGSCEKDWEKWGELLLTCDIENITNDGISSENRYEVKSCGECYEVADGGREVCDGCNSGGRCSSIRWRAEIDCNKWVRGKGMSRARSFGGDHID